MSEAAASGALMAANPYLGAASSIMSGLSGMAQGGPSQAYGGTNDGGGDVMIGGLNVPARSKAEALGQVLVKPLSEPLSAGTGLLFAAGALAVWYLSKR